ncbi:MAG TPA: bifunctional lysine ketoglutarate reductase /saccharopine dehydrogenase family protein [Candidatus Aminicenantes bacterium]|nr:bifunctional lysine ketoglutarate reductase /saccharopine dehydrogenase family protein [Candidatus Aminicenantes bacterium]HRY65134.1 bifunctional lysine ketoglutarate reductase /saccharopine dehydrogenase family protein [Candidatus Aminicenantes bacterium]HRZ72398.1 bifunctional lysine ketoglutarate reductase /saccharopine dehydrogenase family protein [Candidatus Aminicenantes bacterium]
MNIKFGIRREDINKWEKRVPLIPSHARELADRYPIEFRVQPSKIRVFSDDDYRLAGIPVEEGLSPCPIVLALKEIPIELIEKGKTYVFFSHTAKGQSQNMPMLKKMMDMGCTVIDYEKMVDEKGRRVLYFGNYAGHAGMIDTLWTLGRRLGVEGIANPFTGLEPTHRYKSLVEAKEAVGHLGAKLVKDGLPPQLDPLIIGFFGYGHVSQGAQEILDLLPVESVRPADIPGLFKGGAGSRRIIYKAVFHEEDMVRPIEAGRAFDLQDYYTHPEGYRAVTEEFVPYLTALVNGIYWTPKFPKYISKAFLKKLYAGAQPRLRVIGDITCDINGSIECTVQPTDSENPVYVYDPIEDKAVTGFAGRGPAVLAVYNLPAELPLESSTYFSGKFKEHVPALAAARFDKPFAECGLTDVLRRAVIVYRGQLAPDYVYLGEFVG